MSPTAGIFLMMNNYFHDVATALLAASGFVVWVIVKRYDASVTNKDTVEYFLRIYESATKFAKFSFLWIIIGGIPRVIFYTEFEWANAAGKGQVPALIVKHILAFAFVGIGAHLWVNLNKKVKQIKSG